MSNSKFANKLTEVVTCAKCKEALKEPNTFTCFHVFCTPCMKRLPKHNKDGEPGCNCPICNVFSGEKMIKTRLLMNELLDMHLKTETKDGQKCQICGKGEANWNCQHCKIDLCQRCKVNHPKIPACKYHRIIEKGSNFRELFAERLKCELQVTLAGRAIRMAMINGNIWIPIRGANVIQVVDLVGKVVKTVHHQNNPRSVGQASNGDIILASDSGLELITEEGNILKSLKKGKMCDVSVDGDQFSALEYSSDQVSVWHLEASTDTWKQTVCFKVRNGRQYGEGSVLQCNNYTYCTPYCGNNAIDEYSETGTFIKQNKPPSANEMFICGHDDKGAITIANWKNQDLIISYRSGNYEQIKVPEMDHPFDILCDGETVWILHEHVKVHFRLAKYTKT